MGQIPAAEETQERQQPESLLRGWGQPRNQQVMKIMMNEGCKTENTSSRASIDLPAKGLVLDI